MTNVVSSGRFSYCHHDAKECNEMTDVHDILIKTSKTMTSVICLSVLLVMLSLYTFVPSQGKSNAGILLSCLLSAILIVRLKKKCSKKETVVILPAFGVQLETRYWSGRVRRRFIPMEKIVKPVLNECVTPVTCYWSLALILRDEDELLLVFHKPGIPVKLLIPVWKALCATLTVENQAGNSETSGFFRTMRCPTIPSDHIQG